MLGARYWGRVKKCQATDEYGFARMNSGDLSVPICVNPWLRPIFRSFWGLGAGFGIREGNFGIPKPETRVTSPEALGLGIRNRWN